MIIDFYENNEFQEYEKEESPKIHTFVDEDGEEIEIELEDDFDDIEPMLQYRYRLTKDEVDNVNPPKWCSLKEKEYHNFYVIEETEIRKSMAYQCAEMIRENLKNKEGKFVIDYDRKDLPTVMELFQDLRVNDREKSLYVPICKFRWNIVDQTWDDCSYEDENYTRQAVEQQIKASLERKNQLEKYPFLLQIKKFEQNNKNKKLNLYE